MHHCLTSSDTIVDADIKPIGREIFMKGIPCYIQSIGQCLLLVWWGLKKKWLYMSFWDNQGMSWTHWETISQRNCQVIASYDPVFIQWTERQFILSLSI